MNGDLFKDVKLGDRFKTRCGDIAYLINPLWREFVVGIANNSSHIFSVDENGINNINHDWDIISRDEISDRELEEIAIKESQKVILHDGVHNFCPEYCYELGYKAGYKAKK